MEFSFIFLVVKFRINYLAIIVIGVSWREGRLPGVPCPLIRASRVGRRLTGPSRGRPLGRVQAPG
jgi:hypothetical protein